MSGFRCPRFPVAAHFALGVADEGAVEDQDGRANGSEFRQTGVEQVPGPARHRPSKVPGRIGLRHQLDRTVATVTCKGGARRAQQPVFDWRGAMNVDTTIATAGGKCPPANRVRLLILPSSRTRTGSAGVGGRASTQQALGRGRGTRQVRFPAVAGSGKRPRGFRQASAFCGAVDQPRHFRRQAPRHSAERAERSSG